MTNESLPFDDDSPEWTEEMFSHARPADEVLPPATVAVLTRRGAHVEQSQEAALPQGNDDADPLYLAALEVGRDERLAREMLEWDVTAADGLDDLPARDRIR